MNWTVAKSARRAGSAGAAGTALVAHRECRTGSTCSGQAVPGMRPVRAVAVAVVVALAALAPRVYAAESVANGGFEINGGNGSAPAGWVKDFNSYGAYNGDKYTGAFSLHPGSSNNSGGEYQDLVTVPGKTYICSFWMRNFNALSGSSHVEVLVGTPGSATYAFVNNVNSAVTTSFAAAPANFVFALAVGTAWAQQTFSFVAPGATTRIGFYNAYRTGDTVHSVNLDDVTVKADSLSNGGFEVNTGNNSTPTGWVKDFNSYGAYNGDKYTGAFCLHPGSSNRSGGEYQDLVTVPGKTYICSFWMRNFAAAAGSSHVEVLVGTPGSATYTFADNADSAATTSFAVGPANYVFAIGDGTTWARQTFSFVAPGATTRIGFYNGRRNGDTVGSVNLDDVSLGTEGAANGGFETNTGSGSTPTDWVKDFNSYGAYNGDKNTGIWSLHPGASGRSGGAYQDLGTIPGRTYICSFWVRNFAAASGSSHLEVLVGTAGAVTYTFVNNADSAVTTSFAAGPANFVFALAVGTTWARQTFSFVAPGTTTRIGFYNAYRNGDTVHAVNLDDVDLHAAVSTWNNAAGGSWTTPGNWLGAVTADGADATAHFGALDLTADATVTLDGARTIGNLIFGDRTPTHNWMLSAGSAGPLTLDVSSGACTLTVSNQTATVGLALAGSDPVVKAGAGTLVLGGANAYTGTTTVNAGTLLVNGAHTAGAAYSVATGVLGGSDGTIGSAVTVGGAGTLTGGDATTPGTLKITGDVSFVPGGQLLVNIQSGGYDQIDMNNAGAFAPANGALTLVVSPVSYAPAPGTELVVVRNIGGALSGMFSNATEGTEIRAGAGSYVVHYDSSGHRIYLTSRKIDNGSLFLVH